MTSLAVSGVANAQTWVALNDGLTGTSVQVVTFDPTDLQTLYAGTIFRGAYKRTGDAPWVELSNEFAFDTITSIAVSPANPNVLLMGTEEFGAHLSSDGGSNWSPVAAGGRVAFVRQFRFSPHDPSRVLAATEGEGVYLSTDGGAT